MEWKTIHSVWKLILPSYFQTTTSILPIYCFKLSAFHLVLKFNQWMWTLFHYSQMSTIFLKAVDQSWTEMLHWTWWCFTPLLHTLHWEMLVPICQFWILLSVWLLNAKTMFCHSFLEEDVPRSMVTPFLMPPSIVDWFEFELFPLRRYLCHPIQLERRSRPSLAQS